VIRSTRLQLVYQTYGELNGDRSNAILYPTSYGAQHTDIEWLIRGNGILDPTCWLIIIPMSIQRTLVLGRQKILWTVRITMGRTAPLDISMVCFGFLEIPCEF
jgi:hypothetical protein